VTLLEKFNADVAAVSPSNPESASIIAQIRNTYNERVARRAAEAAEWSQGVARHRQLHPHYYL